MPTSDKQSEPSKSGTQASDDNINKGIGCAFMLGFLFVGTIFFIPHLEPEKEEIQIAAPTRTAIVNTLSQSFPTGDIQAKQLGGFNLELWISKQNFQSIIYLDRKAALETIGKSWCDNFGGWKCPSIVVRDEKTGKELGSYHCLFNYAKIEEQ